MEALEFRPQTAQSLTLEWQEMQIMPIGDLQLGASGVDLDRFRKQMAWVKDQERQGRPPIYFLGMGDYIDVMSPSNRAEWRAARVYDSVRVAMDQKAVELEQQFLNEVQGTAGRWLGLLQGHHWFEHEDGTTSDTRIANALGARFLGTCAFVRLIFDNLNRHKLSTTIWAHHGKGNGMMPHAVLNTLYRVMTHFEADIYLMGHTTRKAAVTSPRLVFDGHKIRDQKKILAGTGGFTKGYEFESMNLAGRPEGSYVEQALFAPASLGGIIIRVRPVFGNRHHPDRVDLSVEL